MTIDPTVERAISLVYDTTIDSGMPDTTRATTSTLWVSAERTPFIKCMTPSLPTYSNLDWAKFSAYYYYYDYVSTGAVNVSAHQVVGGDWNQYTLTWNGVVNLPNLGLSTTVLSSVTAYAGNATINNPVRADFYITKLFKDWAKGDAQNYGIALRYATGSTNKSVIFHSSDSTSGYSPRFVYQYTATSVSAGQTYNIAGIATTTFAFAPTQTDLYSLWTIGNADTTIKVVDASSGAIVFQSSAGGHGNNACLTTTFQAGKEYDITITQVLPNPAYNCQFKIYRGLPLSGSELPKYFNEFTSYTQKNNCYTYAISSWGNPLTNDLWGVKGIDPGMLSGESIDLTSSSTAKSTIEAAVKADCVAWGGSASDFYEVSANTMVPTGFYKVALLYRRNTEEHDRDYHWYRQVSDLGGGWAHKLSTNLPEDIDANGNAIYVPHLADWGTYTVFLGYYAIKPPV